jgi:hypothetical protein
MHDTSARLVERVLPAASYRQWVLTVRFPLRLRIARDPGELYAAVHLGQTVGFVEYLAQWVLTRHEVPAATAEMRRHHPALGVLKRWIGRLAAGLGAA